MAGLSAALYADGSVKGKTRRAQLFHRQIVNGDQIGIHPGFLTHTRADRSREVCRKIHYIELEGLAFPLPDLCWRILRGKSVTVTAPFCKREIGNSLGLHDRT